MPQRQHPLLLLLAVCAAAAAICCTADKLTLTGPTVGIDVFEAEAFEGLGDAITVTKDSSTITLADFVNMGASGDPPVENWCETVWPKFETIYSSDRPNLSVVDILSGTAPGQEGFVEKNCGSAIAMSSTQALVNMGGVFNCTPVLVTIPNAGMHQSTCPPKTSTHPVTCSVSNVSVGTAITTEGTSSDASSFSFTISKSYEFAACTFDMKVEMNGACFPPWATVTLADGVTRKRMEDVAVGDVVWCIEHGTGALITCPVVNFCSIAPEDTLKCTHLTAEVPEEEGGGERTLVLSLDHYVWAEIANEEERELEWSPKYGDDASDTPKGVAWVPRGGLYMAGDLKVGDTIFVTRDGDLAGDKAASAAALLPVTITSTHSTDEVGAYSPMTSTGMILVDGVAASNFGVDNPVRNYWLYAHFLQLEQQGKLGTSPAYQIPAKDVPAMGFYNSTHSSIGDAIIAGNHWAAENDLVVDSKGVNLDVHQLMKKGVPVREEVIEMVMHKNAH